jgi:hypothetical protein
MTDADKTREALVAELAEARAETDALRDKAAALESRLAERVRKPSPRQPRREIQADIEFIADFDLVRAEGIDLSEGGICFEVGRDLPFEMRFELEGRRRENRANLVWVRRIGDGRYRLGFQFVPPEDVDPVF